MLCTNQKVSVSIHIMPKCSWASLEKTKHISCQARRWWSDDFSLLCSLDPVWILQLDINLKHSGKSTKEILKKKKESRCYDIAVNVRLEDLKRTVHKLTPTNLDELKQCRKEEWARIPPQ